MSVDLVRIVDSIHRDKNIPKDILFDGIQSALTTAARKHYPDAADIEVHIDRDTGTIDATKDGVKMDPAELGRISAQTAKQVIIQKIREAERDSLYDEFEDQRGDLVTGTVQRFEGGAVIVNLGKTDAILPRSEQIPGESYHPNERIRAIIHAGRVGEDGKARIAFEEDVVRVVVAAEAVELVGLAARRVAAEKLAEELRARRALLHPRPLRVDVVRLDVEDELVALEHLANRFRRGNLSHLRISAALEPCHGA